MKTLFTYLPYALFLLTMLTFVVPCWRRTRPQAIWAMALLLCFSKFLCYSALGGDAFAPELPEKLIWAWNFAYSGAVILAALALAFFFVPVRYKRLLFPVLAWSLALFGLWNGVKDPVVREVTLEYPDLPASLEGYRIVQLSDLHVSAAARRARSERIVELANATRADLMVVTGDIVDGLPAERRQDVEPFRNLKARDGVWWVAGNHENYHDFNRWSTWYARWGIRFLNRECVVPHPGLVLGGANDVGRDGAEAAFARVKGGDFRVLLQHRPSMAAENVAKLGVDLQLSGHTHGGIMPGLDMVVKRHNGGFVRGLYEIPGADGKRSGRLYVSPGTGQWAGFPVRFFNDAEITVFTLRRK